MWIIHKFKKDYLKKIIFTYFQPASSSSKLLVTRAYPSSAGGKAKTHPGEDTLPSQGRALTHRNIHTDWDNVDVPIHLSCQSLGCGRTLEYSHKTHPDVGRTCTQTVALARNQYFFLINNVIKHHGTKQYYLKTCCCIRMVLNLLRGLSWGIISPIVQMRRLRVREASNLVKVTQLPNDVIRIGRQAFCLHSLHSESNFIL